MSQQLLTRCNIQLGPQKFNLGRNMQIKNLSSHADAWLTNEHQTKHEMNSASAVQCTTPTIGLLTTQAPDHCLISTTMPPLVSLSECSSLRLRCQSYVLARSCTHRHGHSWARNTCIPAHTVLQRTSSLLQPLKSWVTRAQHHMRSYSSCRWPSNTLPSTTSLAQFAHCAHLMAPSKPAGPALSLSSITALSPLQFPALNYAGSSLHGSRTHSPSSRRYCVAAKQTPQPGIANRVWRPHLATPPHTRRASLSSTKPRPRLSIAGAQHMSYPDHLAATVSETPAVTATVKATVTNHNRPRNRFCNRYCSSASSRFTSSRITPSAHACRSFLIASSWI